MGGGCDGDGVGPESPEDCLSVSLSSSRLDLEPFTRVRLSLAEQWMPVAGS